MQNCKNVAANLLLFDYLSDFAEKDSSGLNIQASSHRAWSFQWARRLSCPYCYTKSHWKGESFEESLVLLWTWPNLTRKRIQKRCKRYFCKDPPVRLFAQSSNCARRLKIMMQKTGIAGLAGTTSIALVGKNGARRRGARMLMRRKTRLEDILSDLLRTHTNHGDGVGKQLAWLLRSSRRKISPMRLKPQLPPTRMIRPLKLRYPAWLTYLTWSFCLFLIFTCFILQYNSVYSILYTFFRRRCCALLNVDICPVLTFCLVFICLDAALRQTLILRISETCCDPTGVRLRSSTWSPIETGLDFLVQDHGNFWVKAVASRITAG